MYVKLSIYVYYSTKLTINGINVYFLISTIPSLCRTYMYIRLLKLAAAIINMACDLLQYCVGHYVHIAIVDRSFSRY